MRFATKAVHIGNEPDTVTGAVMPPIYMTSTFELEGPEQSRGYEYTRGNNPNFTRLEKQLASLEEAKHATVFSSGIGALTAMVSTLSQGDKVLALDGIYGGTYRLFNHIFNRFGIEFINIIKPDRKQIEEALKQSPKWMMFETPTNPLMNIFDIRELATLAKKYNVLSVVDSTFASPYCQNALQLGVDIVWHSTTKYLSGHSDVLGGVVMTNDANFKKSLDFARKTLGVNPSPFDCWLIMRGVKTLPVRMQQHEKNALALAQFLEKHPLVEHVYYPGLPSHPHYSIAKKQMKHFNGMMSVEFKIPVDKLLKKLTTFKYFTLAESLGGIESLVCHPYTMTHSIVPIEERKLLGIGEGLIRFSIGIEDTDDLLEDMQGFLTLK